MQCLSGRVLDSRPRGRGFEPHQRHCVVSLSKNINPSLVLIQPRKIRPFITERLLMGHKESNLTNSLIWVCAVCLGLFSRWRVFKILGLLLYLWRNTLLSCQPLSCQCYFSWKCLLLTFCCLYSRALQTRFYHVSKHYELWSDCSIGSRLIWVHIVCNITYLKPKQIRAVNKSCEWQEKGIKSCSTKSMKLWNCSWTDWYCPTCLIRVSQWSTAF